MELSSSPFVTPTNRDDLMANVDTYVKAATDDSEIREETRRILSFLPDKVTSKDIVTLRCRKPADQAVEEFGGGEDVHGIRTGACREVSLTLYRDYIEDSIERIKQHCENNTPPERWWLGNMVGWKDGDDSWGVKFYNFWHAQIEKGVDSVFKERILNQLPAEWQKGFERKGGISEEVKGFVDKKDWKGIAKRIKGLTKHKNPAQKRWGLGSMEYWKDGEKRWGRGFVNVWRRYVEEEGDEKFRECILPLLPEKWRENYEMNSECPYDWVEMAACGDWKGIADVLIGLEKNSDPSQTEWWLGSIALWNIDELKPWGRSFYYFWRNYMDSKGDKLFKKHLYPHFPKEWQPNFQKDKRTKTRNQ